MNALFTETSMLPIQPPPMRRCDTRLPPSSTTAMFDGIHLLETKLAWWQDRNVAGPQFQQPVARCRGRAPLRFRPWQGWPLPYAATALHTHFRLFGWHT
jgi:hypothetical protein